MGHEDIVWVDVVSQLEASAAERGWDQPVQLLVIAPAETAGGESDELVVLPRVLEGNPRAALRGLTAPGALAVALITEGWAATRPSEPGDVRPRDNPARREVRHVCLITAAGECLTLMRVRDEEPERLEQGSVSGALPELLARVIGVEPPATQHRVGELLGIWALQVMTTMVGRGAMPTSGTMLMCVERIIKDLEPAFAIPAGGVFDRARELERIVTWPALVDAPESLRVPWLDRDMAAWFGPSALANLMCERLTPHQDAYAALLAAVGEDAADDCRIALDMVGWLPAEGS